MNGPLVLTQGGIRVPAVEKEAFPRPFQALGRRFQEGLTTVKGGQRGPVILLAKMHQSGKQGHQGAEFPGHIHLDGKSFQFAQGGLRPKRQALPGNGGGKILADHGVQVFHMQSEVGVLRGPVPAPEHQVGQKEATYPAGIRGTLGHGNGLVQRNNAHMRVLGKGLPQPLQQFVLDTVGLFRTLRPEDKHGVIPTQRVSPAPKTAQQQQQGPGGQGLLAKGIARSPLGNASWAFHHFGFGRKYHVEQIQGRKQRTYPPQGPHPQMEGAVEIAHQAEEHAETGSQGHQALPEALQKYPKTPHAPLLKCLLVLWTERFSQAST